MKLSFSKKQIKIIIAALILVLILFLVYIFIINKSIHINKKISGNQSGVFKPIFLDEAEKTRLNIRPENKVQVIKRNAEGKIILYKVIQNNNDIVTDLNQIKPVVSASK